MDRPIGNRFVIRDNEIVKKESGEVVPLDEPLFLLRGRDYLALPLLEKFKDMCILDGCNDYLLELLEEMLYQFHEFKKNHPERMKQPGVTRGK